MKESTNRRKTIEFVERWIDRGDEKSHTQQFWTDLLEDVLGVRKASEVIKFEDRVMLENTSFIDATIPETHVLIEQKSINKDLLASIKQSDGSYLNSFEQAKRYADKLPYTDRARWIVTCNFQEFHVYDMQKPNNEPSKIMLKDLANESYRLRFLIDSKKDIMPEEKKISLEAGEIIANLYNNLLQKYNNPNDPQTLMDLNILCVRLVFCFYAEDAGLFGSHNMFHDYLSQFKGDSFRTALINVFKILNQKEDERDPYLDSGLANFPYVNGGLFEKSNIEIPRLDSDIRDIILNKASLNFNWSEISPTIFGAVFESTLNPETRKSGGMHYTSIENIHKVIDPLFLNDLLEEFEEIKNIKTLKTRQRRLKGLQDKLASISFLDPAAGSGNFLTETYISLRRIENEIIKELYGEQIVLGIVDNPVKVNLNQFYGIEINDFAVTVAKTALWISEAQLLKATEDIIHQDINFLPLKSYSNIVDANAIDIEWTDVVDINNLDYIIGNPPFIGGMRMSAQQKKEVKESFNNIPGSGEIDYVTAWYKKSAEIMQKNPKIKTALVSTNSVSQGIHPGIYWKHLVDNYNTEIIFAHDTFKWDSEATMKAQVHVVIIGFVNKNNNFNSKKYLFDDGKIEIVDKLNGYLVEADEVYLESRTLPISDVPRMNFGNMPRDGGGFILSEEEKENLIIKEPIAEQWIHPYLGAAEFINKRKRYCLWLVDADPSELKKSPTVMKRIEAVKDMRASSKAKSTQKMALTPTRFAQITQPIGKSFIMIPRVSSEKRRYVPMGFLPGDVIASDASLIIPDANLYEFGVLNSNVHMGWMRAVGGRLEMRYRYSKDIVYNNFPWPQASLAQKEKITRTAQAILDARNKYPNSSLADLYDITMPAELINAHILNNKAVMEAYGFDWRTMTESECVAELMKMYQNLVNQK